MDNRNLTVSITVVAFSDIETIRQCLTSLGNQKATSPNVNLIRRILVNDSRKISVKTLKEEFPDCEFVTPSVNLGYAGAIKNAWSDDRADIIIVTNDDVVFREGWLDGILAPFIDENVFATTCSIINKGEDEEKANGTLNPIGIRIPDVFPDRSIVLYPSGAAFAFRRDNIEPVDPTYFLYYEDVYLGLFARLRGFNIVMNPDAKVDHLNRLSTSKIDRSYLHYLQEKNRIANIFIFFSVVTLIKLIPYLIVDLIIQIVRMITLKKRPDAILRVWLYYLTHVGTTLSKRFQVLEHRKVRDSEILKYMSGKLLPESGKFTRIINRFFLGYARLVGLNFVEMRRNT